MESGLDTETPEAVVGVGEVGRQQSSCLGDGKPRGDRA